MRRFLLPMVTGLLLASCAHETDPAYVAEIDQWHAGRIERLRDPEGWLTLVGLHPLQEGINTVGSAAGQDVQLIEKAPARVGTITVAGDSIMFTAYPGTVVVEALAGSGPPLTRHKLRTDAGGEPTVLAAGPLVMHVIDRDGRLFLRVKDTESEVLAHFAGIDRFPVDDRWRVAARLESGEESVKVPNVLGQVNEVPSPGVLVFTVQGTECRLTPQGRLGEPLFLVFGDRTNGKTTYGGGRFLVTEPAGADGTVIVDFNRAYNPPCVFTPYATCPVPSPDNLLPVAVTAGEKMWGEPH